MILTKLPENVARAVFKLTTDQQFQQRFAKDKVLDILQAQKHNKFIEGQELQLLVNRRNMFFDIAFKPITLALYCYLYTMKSNIVFDISKVTFVDLDIFFYLLQTKNYSYNYEQVLKNSIDYGSRVLGLNSKQLIEVFNKIYSIEFKALSLFPRITNGDDEPVFNIDWIINITSKIKSYVSYSTQEIYTQVPIMQIYYYYASYLRNNGSDSIFARSDQQILDEMDDRIIDLVIERLIQKQILKKDQHKEYFDLMKQKKEDSNG